MSRYVKYFVQAKKLDKRKRKYYKLDFLEMSKELSIPFPLREQNQPKRLDLSKYLNIEVGDLVKVLYGPDKDKEGIILNINPKKNTVIVDGCNMKKSAWNVIDKKGSIITQEMPIHITNVSILDPINKKPTVVKRRYMMNGECVRISKISGCAMPEPVNKNMLKEQNNYELFMQKKKIGPPIKDIYAEKDRKNFNLLKKITYEIKRKRFYEMKNFFKTDHEGDKSGRVEVS
ncbi:50S ribosomal protein L24 [Plasmodium brasilianum]|uniref:Large ribosomal subunit protein uL24c n=2 Tax=Plasmodium (Plasmodium) TaxID=418103 RepID=A0A1A8WDE3_PLAMA|nr:50S ribosomal protein L24, putative [Plasmodium malariae]KAI4834951.1 50S ribosomal protein L24 [Plasmodium brasilianum]SBS90907.1 50S ribosomal protein L24, putative [Plasmodium malariae]SCP03522.1 50S ribosomal protein L24, putative [Plasmodium malariae]